MKIGSFDNKLSPAPVASERKPPAAQSGASAQASAKVELSATVSAMTNPGADTSFDKAKVDRITQAIRDGKFEINADAIADKLIANAEELLAGRTR